MDWAIGLVVIMLLVLVLMRWSPRRRKRIRKTRAVRPVRICGDCHQPRGKCQHDTKNAEHWEGMLGPRKK
jgi:hypothetical protein